MPEDWWPDWRGDTVVIAASGPSQRKEDLDHARGKARVMAINNTWQLCPWADALYACDQAWWLTDAPGYGGDAVRNFPGLKVAGQRNPHVPRIKIDQINSMLWTKVEFGGGGNSAFQAVMLALLWGVRDGGRIVLTGCDCRKAGNHWHGRHVVSTPLAQTPPDRHEEWIRNWAKLAKALDRSGVPIVNCTRDTAIPEADIPRAVLDGVL